MLYDIYPWIKALHIVAVISWLAGLLYLPRLFVYHAAATVPEQAETFCRMEERLLRIIMRPAMIATWGLGIILAAIPGVIDWGSDYWLYVKVVLVVVMTGFNGMLARHARAFARGENAKPQRYFRMINEVPTVLMIAIVILVVVRPF